MTSASKPPCYYCQDENHAMIDCPDYISLRNSAAAVREQWRDKHKCCPQCGNDSMPSTYAGPIHIIGQPYEDNVNSSWCSKCGWKGMVKELTFKTKNI